ncbi:pentapeptide repeat-containing protein [Streptomyces kanamyceticus]|uniref:pentapeptide repeat-containing protein n=1 Tax=Streptomyces kanamyceticus TaxID=1967 RepID=UPI0037DD2CE9
MRLDRHGADLRGASLSDVDLRDADLSGTDPHDVKGLTRDQVDSGRAHEISSCAAYVLPSPRGPACRSCRTPATSGTRRGGPCLRAQAPLCIPRLDIRPSRPEGDLVEDRCESARTRSGIW